MMKGRNLHWNVYYDMLALSANEKQKLKGTCKFTSTFGIAWSDNVVYGWVHDIIYDLMFIMI